MKTKLSLVAATCLVGSSMYAGTVDFTGGWNLVTVPSNIAINKSVIPNLISVTTFNGMSPVSSSRISTLDIGKGYWINVSSDTSITFEDGTIRLPSFQAGWNLVGLPSGSTDVTENIINEAGYKFDSIMTFNGMSPVSSSRITEIDTTKGYWVYLQAIGATVETADGFDVKLYVDSPNDDISTLATSLSNYTLAELGTNTSLDFSDVSNLVVTTNINGTDVSTTYLNPNDSGFNTALTAEISTTLDQTYTETAQATSGASIYIYGASEGGSPFILNSVNVFAVNTDGSRGALVGTTSATGYLYLSSVSTDASNPTKVMIEKDGFESSLQEITAVAGGASYLFISEDDGTGIFSDSAIDDGATTARALNLTNAKNYKARVGSIGVPAGSSLKRGSALKVRNSSWNSFAQYNDMAGFLEVPGYFIEPLGKMYAKGKSDNRWGYTHAFSDILDFSTESGAGTADGIKGILALRNLSDNMQDRLADESGAVTSTSVAAFKENVAVYIFKNGDWEAVDQTKFTLEVPNATNDFDALENDYINDRVYSRDLDAIITVDGSVYTGPYSMFAIYKENMTQDVDLSYDTYTLNVTVKDENGIALPNSAVTLTRGTAGADIIKAGDANGQVSFSLLVSPNQNETFNLNVMQGNHYPVSTTYNISGLNPVSNGISNTNLVVSLMAPPEYATVKGEVSDTTAATISNAKVNLVFPIALADVQKDVVKVIDDQQLKGVSVSNIPNTRYSWYIKKHTDVLDNATPTRTLARVSSDRWILVQRGSAAQDANFLPYNKVVNQVLSRPLDNDPDDVKIVASGQFDIAVQVEHDIDSDGSYDFTELAVNNENTSSNLSGEEFATSIDNDYGRTIGFISTTVNVEAMMDDLGEIDLFNDRYYAKVNDGDWLTISNDLDGDDVSYHINNSLVPSDVVDSWDEYIGVERSFRLDGSQEGRLVTLSDAVPEGGVLEKIDWSILISATIATNSGNIIVALDNNHNWVSIDSLSADAVADENKLIPVAKYVKDSVFRESRLRISTISNKISENQFMEKLAMPLSDILSEAGVTSTATNADQILFNDGFTLGVVPTATYSTQTITDTTPVDINVTFRNLVDFGFNNMDLKEYINIGDVNVQRPVLMEDEQTDFTDRVGLFSFPAVPLGFGSLDNVNSLLRVNTEKLGFYGSPVLNVEKFTQDDASSVEREDVQRVDMTLDTKPQFDVVVNVVDQNGVALPNALVTLDGIYVNSDEFLTEFESASTLEGSTVTFNNVIGGRNSNRILKVLVPSDGSTNYIPKIQTIRNLNADTSITIEVVNTTDVADSNAVISVLEKEINFERGTGTLKARIFDKADGTLTDSAEIVIYHNDRIVNVPIQRDGDIVTISGTLEIGRNNVVIEVLNTAGRATSSNIIFDYNPTIGSVNGRISGFSDLDNDQNLDSGSVLFMDIFDAQSNYINSLTLPSNGEYVLQDLEADKQLKLQVMEVNATNGRLLKKSDLTAITVPSAAMIRVDMVLSDVVQSVGITGAPVFDFLRDIRSADINQTTGMMNVSMTLSNYDNLGDGRVGINVNGVLQEVPVGSITSTGADYTYAITNFPIQLRPGSNVVFGMAVNPSGEFDYTRDQFIEWNPTGDSLLTTANIQVQGCDLNTTATPATAVNCQNMDGITTVELFDQYGSFVNYIQTNTTGAGTFTNLAEGNYTVFAQSENPQFGFQEIPMPIFGNAVENIGINLIRESDVINIPEFEIMGMDINSTSFEVNADYNASVNIMTSDMNYDGYVFNWTLNGYDSNYMPVSTLLSECTTQECTFSVPQTGWTSLSVNIAKGDVQRDFSQEIYVQETIPESAPSTPTIDGIPSTPEI